MDELVMDELVRERELFTRFGSAGSEAMFDYPCHFFQIPNLTGIIAYRIEFKCAVVFGDPICPINELTELVEAFHKYCREAKLNVIYVIVSEGFKKVVEKRCKIFLQVCEEMILNPQFDSHSSHRLQQRMDKAVKHGLSFHEYIPCNKEIEKKLIEIGNQWQAAIKGVHLYLGHLNFFESYIGKRWFYVKDAENITGMAMLSQLDAQGGWLLKFLATIPNAFSGTSEYLVLSLLKKLREENCHYLTKGMLPVDSLNEIQGISRGSQFILKKIYKLISLIFRFKKRKEYWQRYHPKKAPAYLVFFNSRIGFNEIRALKKVFRMQ